MINNNENNEPLNKSFKVPKLRFPEFKDEWNSVFLKDLVSIHARIGWQGLRQEEFLNEGDYYLITGTDFKNGRINIKEIKYISKFRYEQDKNIQVKNGDILITKDGSIGKVVLVKDMDKFATLNAGVYRIRPLKNNVMNTYLFQYLSAPFLLNFALKQSSGGTIKHLNQSQIIKFKIPLPSTNEQNKISCFLNLIDNKIEILEAKISTLKKYKEGLLLWAYKLINIKSLKLKHYIENGTITLGRGEIIPKQDGEFPVYSSSAQNNGFFCTRNKYSFDEELVTWSIDGGGIPFYRHKHKFSITNVCGYAKINKLNYLNYSWLYINFWNSWRKQNFDYTSKAHPSIIENLYTIKLVPIEYQNKLGNILFKINEKIEYQENILDDITILKKALLRNLFI